MTLALNNFEGGSNGTAVTVANSGGASGTAWTAVGATGTVAYDNTHVAHGGLSCKMATTTSADVALTWSTAVVGSAAQLWFRVYCYLTANPPAGFPIFSADTSGGAAQCGAFTIETTGQMTGQDSAFTGIFTTTNTIPLNQWFRVEGFVIGSATVGQLELKLFDSMDSTTATETQTSAATLNTSGNIAQVFFSFFARANTGPFWIDDAGISDQGYLGPVVVTSPPMFPAMMSRPAVVPAFSGRAGANHSR